MKDCSVSYLVHQCCLDVQATFILNASAYIMLVKSITDRLTHSSFFRALHRCICVTIVTLDVLNSATLIDLNGEISWNRERSEKSSTACASSSESTRLRRPQGAFQKAAVHTRVNTRAGIRSFWRVTHAHWHTLGRACLETPGLSFLQRCLSLCSMPPIPFSCTKEHTFIFAQQCLAVHGLLLHCWCAMDGCLHVHKFYPQIFSMPFNVFFTKII